MKTKDKNKFLLRLFFIKKLFDRYVRQVQKLSMELIKQAIFATDSVLVAVKEKKRKIFESH